ncbi:hypothetical protein DMH04_48700 [Kibdelosporangium aridum]|uniref:Uncharacterized protein n=1 Tax=Kibdelosporangium aridum TaxID=2030 RepID=A0A428YJ51_KIBAR|nr:hypothetical protein [Kibdelosporangium aridum]RSM67579.1 hypothetical protein DMH04_48700 [Kibdelosporangium aridum]
MPHPHRDRPFTGDPLTTLTSLAESDAFTDFVLYEGNDSWSLTGGVLAAAVLCNLETRATARATWRLAHSPSQPL